MVENYGNGDAPCGQCGKHIEDILIDLDSVEDDGNGGRWYKGIPDQICPFCGEPLNWYHIPAKKEEN